MKIALATLALVGSLLITAAAPVVAQEVLTNDSLIRMVRAGLPESVILARIRSSQTKFDVSTDALIALREGGASDKILEAVAVPSADAAPAPPATRVANTPPPPPAPTESAVSTLYQIPPGVVVPPQVLAALQARGAQMSPTPGAVFHTLGTKQIELTPVGAEIQTNTNRFLGSVTRELVLPGSKAGYRTTERQPVFLSPSMPSDMPLVRLKPGSDDRNLKFGSFSKSPFVGTTQRQGVRAEDRIDVEAERDAQGFYRVRPRKPLEPGEYGFILTIGLTGGTSGKVYDFGVD